MNCLFKRKVFLLATALLAMSGCTYRFTNLYITPPQNMKTIAIEAVYDTSRNVISHAPLWRALQEAFARNGHLIVTSRKNADAILRAHIRKAETNPFDTLSTQVDKIDESKIYDLDTPPAVASHRNLTQASSYANQDSLGINIYVDVIDLHSRKKLFSKSYFSATKFNSLVALSTTAERKNAFLKHTESIDKQTAVISESIARRVVQDFLVKI